MKAEREFVRDKLIQYLDDPKKEPSPLGIKVGMLLHDVFAGIYHLNRASLGKVEWDNNHHIIVTIRGELATYDGDYLTRLIVLSHDRMLRMSIEGAAHRYLRLTFHQRTRRIGGSVWERMPMIEDQIKRYREVFGPPGWGLIE